MTLSSNRIHFMRSVT